MKHTKHISIQAPAFCVTNHPDLKDSITGFLADPIGVLMGHIAKDEDEA